MLVEVARLKFEKGFSVMGNGLKRMFEAVTLVGVPGWWGFAEVFIIGFVATMLIRRFVEERAEFYPERWLGFTVGMTVGLPICGFFIARGLRHHHLSNREAIVMYTIAIVLACVGRMVGVWNSANTAKSTGRTLEIPSEWYFANIMWPLLLAIIVTGWLVLAFSHRPTTDKLLPLLGMAVVAAAIIADKVRGN